MNSQKPGSKSSDKRAFTENSAAQRKKARAYIITFFGIVIATVVLSLALMGAITHFEETDEHSGGSLLFHQADYDYDILKDEQYLELDRDVRFFDPSNGITVAIIDGNLEDVPSFLHDSVGLICNFVDYAIKGETERLNDLFSDEYIEADGKLKMDFTMQQLYNIKIAYVTSSSAEVDGSTHVSHDFWLEYMIRKNNGTFRNDMESDCIRKEYVRVTDRNGTLGIDVLAPYTTATVNEQSNFGNRFVTMMTISALVVVGSFVVVLTLLNLSKKRRGRK